MKNIEEKIVKSALYGCVMHFYFSCKKFQKVRITGKIFFLHLRGYSLLPGARGHFRKHKGGDDYYGN